MIDNNKVSNIPCRLHNVGEGGVAGADEVIDDNKGKSQQQINAEVDQILGAGGSVDERIATAVAPKANSADVYAKTETYNKTELNNMITTPNQEYVTVTATDQTTAATDVLPASGSADTVYRVGNWDGTQYNDSVFSEYAWNGSAYIKLSTKSQIGEVYDISANHAGTKYADLAAALGTNGANIPESLRKGGMSVKFVQSSDNKYVQYRLMANAFSTDVIQWQGVDDEPTDGSENLVKSGGVDENLIELDTKYTEIVANTADIIVGGINSYYELTKVLEKGDYFLKILSSESFVVSNYGYATAPGVSYSTMFDKSINIVGEKAKKVKFTLPSSAKYIRFVGTNIPEGVDVSVLQDNIKDNVEANILAIQDINEELDFGEIDGEKIEANQLTKLSENNKFLSATTSYNDKVLHSIRPNGCMYINDFDEKTRNLIYRYARNIGSLTYDNPIMYADVKYDNIDAGDPTIVIGNDGCYYMTHSCDEMAGAPDLLPLYRSSNLVDWQKIGNIVNEDIKDALLNLMAQGRAENNIADEEEYNQKDGRICLRLWAPHLVRVNEKWLCYVTMPYGRKWNAEYPAGSGQFGGNLLYGFVLSANELSGKWKLETVLFCGDKEQGDEYHKLKWNSIDISTIWYGGSLYMLYGTNGVNIVKLANDGLSIQGTSILLTEEANNCEAGYMFWRDGYFYLMTSIGGAGRNAHYAISITRSTSPFSGFVDQNGTYILNDARNIKKMFQEHGNIFSVGHNSRIVRDKEGREFCMYGGYTETGKRKLFLQEIEWDKSTGYPHFKGVLPQEKCLIPNI
jgi:hypothetical protein